MKKSTKGHRGTVRWWRHVMENALQYGADSLCAKQVLNGRILV
ncbi:unnamed protein product [Chondrus crispus]|uniref:Uncharacterized protein n=1 Tax=Chondrus crispus TaxID=2769 RepID=R7QQV3_CHOCR|nr:unnamed protein product [Chondrus crispus]CDF40133.1 unnamed protein product [Chondrus crispus]|eukprot:XP_005710427.1 unnamed protein product [Chondrus crispus]